MLPVVGSMLGTWIEPVVTLAPGPESKISPPKRSGTLSRIIEAVTGSVPKLDDEPKFESVIGSRKISGVLT
jgi:hypothetical protein